MPDRMDCRPSAETGSFPEEPPRDCERCPRLEAFRRENKLRYPTFYNGPVPSFGACDAELLVVGLAPGLKGANQTGRPFTGDFAGDLLYEALLRFGYAKGDYAKRADDGLRLVNCRITNAVRCVPPENKPIGPEVKNCSGYLSAELKAMPNLKVVLCLGGLSHGALLAALGLKRAAYPFVHNRFHELENRLVLADSYHCSRYNTNTGRLTPQMFYEVFEKINERLSVAAQPGKRAQTLA